MASSNNTGSARDDVVSMGGQHYQPKIILFRRFCTSAPAILSQTHIWRHDLSQEVQIPRHLAHLHDNTVRASRQRLRAKLPQHLFQQVRFGRQRQTTVSTHAVNTRSPRRAQRHVSSLTPAESPQSVTLHSFGGLKLYNLHTAHGALQTNAV